MYSGGSTRSVEPDCRRWPIPERLNVRRNCPFSVSISFCTFTSLSCSRSEGSTTPPRPSSSPGARRCLSGAVMGLHPPNGRHRSSTSEVSNKGAMTARSLLNCKSLIATIILPKKLFSFSVSLRCLQWTVRMRWKGHPKTTSKP